MVHGIRTALIVLLGALPTSMALADDHERQRMIVEFSLPGFDYQRAAGAEGDVLQSLLASRAAGIMMPVLGEVPVTRLDAAPPPDRAAILRVFQYTPAVVMNLTAAESEVLRHLIEVRSVRPDGLDNPVSAPGPDRMNVSEFVARPQGGAGTAVAILDTGVDHQHEMFAGRITASACFSTAVSGESQSFCPGGAAQDTTSELAGDNCPMFASNGLPVGGCDHGTHVAGIAVGSRIEDSGSPGRVLEGIATEAGIVAVQVFSMFEGSEFCGSGHPCALSYNSDTLAALEWIYNERARLNVSAINMSLGSGRHTSACPDDIRAPIIGLLRDAGILTVIASGNDGYEDAVNSPACIAEAITVSSDTTIANRNYLADISAPGANIRSAIPGSTNDASNGVASKSGTSMAAPHVAGTIALMRAAYPDATAGEIESALEAAASGDSVLEGPRPAMMAGTQALGLLNASGAGWSDGLRVDGLEPLDVTGPYFRHQFLTRLIRLHNTGNTTTNWSITSPTGWILSHPASGSLAPGEQAEIEIGIDSDALTEGTFRTAIWIGNAAYSRRLPISVAAHFTVPPPVNDNLENAFMLGAHRRTINFDYRDATAEAGEPAHAGLPAYRTLWWRYDAESDVEFLVNASNANHRIVGLYSGTSINNLVPVSVSDANSGSRGPAAEGRFSAGNSYFILVGDVEEYRKTFGQLHYSVISSAPSNDDIGSAVEISGPAGRLRVNPGRAGQAGAEESYFGSNGATIWYRWTAPEDGEFVFAPAQQNAVIRAFLSEEFSDSNMVLEFFDDASIHLGGVLSAQAGQAYYISLSVPTATEVVDLIWHPQSRVPRLRAAVLPAARAVYPGTPATVFATIINPTANGPVTGCRILQDETVGFNDYSGRIDFYQTDPLTNQIIGDRNEAVNIPAGGHATFLIELNATEFDIYEISPVFTCNEAWAEDSDLSTIRLTSLDEPVPDIIAMSATISGNGIVSGDAARAAAFSIATINLGPPGTVRLEPRLTGEGWDTAQVEFCETDPATGACLSERTGFALIDFGRNEAKTFAVFVRFNGAVIPLSPETNRVNISFDATVSPSPTVGQTSVAVTSR